MTIAICIKCGEFKFGAFNACGKCGALPETEDDYSLSFVLTDHFSSQDELAKIGKEIAAGAKPKLSPELRESLMPMSREAMERCQRMANRSKPPEG